MDRIDRMVGSPYLHRRGRQPARSLKVTRGEQRLSSGYSFLPAALLISQSVLI
jgi:hypothetical protein